MVLPLEPGCWLHPDVEIRPSPIQGRGLFAGVCIGAGTAVVRLGGRLVSGEELRRLLSAAARAGTTYVDTIVVAEDLHLIIAPGQPIHYGNHSCDPNLWWVGPYALVARRPIEPGEEVTHDYATSTGTEDFTMICACGSALCRGRITGADWRRPDLRERYGDHWVPALLARITTDA